jgi:transposase
MRLYPADPGNPRFYIEGESPRLWRTYSLKWPTNISPLFIPAGCPELNAAENVWQYLRQTYLSNRVFQTYDAVVEAAAKAWNRLVAEVGRIASITTRSWAVRRQ